MLAQLPRKSGTADAIRYALARWTALGRFIDDGTIEIDNNAAERSIRPITLGRKNWLFTGSDRGGERAASILSLIVTAKHNGLDPKPICAASSPKSPTIPFTTASPKSSAQKIKT